MSYALSRHGIPSATMLASAFVRFFFWSCFFLMLVVSIFATAQLVITQLKRTATLHGLMTGILGIFALIAVSSVVPSISPRYVWWAMPIGIFLLVAFLARVTQVRPTLLRPFSLMAVICAVALGIAIVAAYGARLPLKNEWSMGTGIFSGMYMPTDDRNRYEELVKFLDSNISQTSSIFFWCDTPIPSVATNSFLSASKFVAYSVPGNSQGSNAWSQGLARDMGLTKGLVLLCVNSAAEATFKSYTENLQLKEIGRSDSGTFKLFTLLGESAVD